MSCLVYTYVKILYTCTFSDSDDVFGFYKVSTMYYGMIAIGICMLMATLISLVSGKQIQYYSGVNIATSGMLSLL